MELIVCSDELIERVIGADIIVDESLVVEVKACSTLEPIHLAQTMSYQNQLHFKRGLLINFHCRLLRDGIKRVSI